MTHDKYKNYQRTGVAQMRPWTPDTNMERVSVSAADREAGSPKEGDMIARNPQNYNDQWLVAAAYFRDNFTEAKAQIHNASLTKMEVDEHEIVLAFRVNARSIYNEFPASLANLEATIVWER